MSTAGLEPVAFEPHMLEMKSVDPEIMDRVWGLKARVDASVTFEEYQYWAKIERAEELELNRLYKEERGPVTVGRVVQNRFSKGGHNAEQREIELRAKAASRVAAEHLPGGEKSASTHLTDASSDRTEDEWKTLARKLRTASWGTIFYLITTDILGWSSTPFVFASVGWGPGVALYIIFGAFAAFSGWTLWRVFLGLDSSRYPMQSFGDPFFRIYGPKSRHFINVGQALQQFMTVAVLILGNGTIIAQLAGRHVCYIVCFLIVMIVGIILGSIRSLQRLGWLCNASVWMNIVSFIIIMVACAHFGIDYAVVTKSTLIKKIEPIKTFVGPPPDAYQEQAYGFAGQFNGINNMVYSYGGALLFIAFMAEMRHPMDFWKGMLCAQAFICIVYILFGAFVYGHFGQYSAVNIGQVIQPLALQTVGNVFGLLTGMIACLLYFNIGMKTVYIEVFQQILKFPEITTQKGKWLWFLLGPMYWIVAFIVAASVPNLGGIVSVVGAFLILNFTYTFPAILYVGYRCQVDAALPGEGFDPVTRITTRHDSGMKRWVRGFMKYWYLNTFSILYFCGGLACCGMGGWAGITGLISIFGPGGTVATSWSCKNPV